MSASNRAPAVVPPALRILFGLAAIGMLLQNAPWEQTAWPGIAIGVVGPVMFGLMALGDRKDHLFRNLATGAAVVYLALVVVKLLGPAA